eukprot:TRINITY_DN10144_c0_g1_i1.p1 TRINITY_DN10144_c0_g1~~TRINITY_DN10144_c0_g1_i1.p1  ORF type:complete len:636 (+),score=113.77 TRINITY_DN10144_c0_g1_i1:38-1945(+)
MSSHSHAKPSSAESHHMENVLPHLPRDMMQEILSYVDLKSVQRLKLTARNSIGFNPWQVISRFDPDLPGVPPNTILNLVAATQSLSHINLHHNIFNQTSDVQKILRANANTLKSLRVRYGNLPESLVAEIPVTLTKLSIALLSSLSRFGMILARLRNLRDLEVVCQTTLEIAQGLKIVAENTTSLESFTMNARDHVCTTEYKQKIRPAAAESWHKLADSNRKLRVVNWLAVCSPKEIYDNNVMLGVDVASAKAEEMEGASLKNVGLSLRVLRCNCLSYWETNLNQYQQQGDWSRWDQLLRICFGPEEYELDASASQCLIGRNGRVDPYVLSKSQNWLERCVELGNTVVPPKTTRNVLLLAEAVLAAKFNTLIEQRRAMLNSMRQIIALDPALMTFLTSQEVVVELLSDELCLRSVPPKFLMLSFTLKNAIWRSVQILEYCKEEIIQQPQQYLIDHLHQLSGRKTAYKSPEQTAVTVCRWFRDFAPDCAVLLLDVILFSASFRRLMCGHPQVLAECLLTIGTIPNSLESVLFLLFKKRTKPWKLLQKAVVSKNAAGQLVFSPQKRQQLQLPLWTAAISMSTSKDTLESSVQEILKIFPGMPAEISAFTHSRKTSVSIQTQFKLTEVQQVLLKFEGR